MVSAKVFIISQAAGKINCRAGGRVKKNFFIFLKFMLDIFRYLWYYNIRSARDKRGRQVNPWGYSSAGRALEWHSRGQRFDPAYLHQKRPEIVRFQAFFLCLRANKSVHYFLRVPRVEYLLNRARNYYSGFMLWPILNERGGCRFDLHPPLSLLYFYQWAYQKTIRMKILIKLLGCFPSKQIFRKSMSILLAFCEREPG